MQSGIRSISACGRWTALLCGVAVLACLGSARPAHADTTSGLDDFRAGRFSEAVQAWRTEAERGDAASALYLGVLYDTGVGVAQDPEQALRWYRHAGEDGSVTGMFNAAVMFDTGRGIAADRAQAVDWYERAAKAGSGRADYNLALLYQAGDGVAPDRGRAVRLYRAAASHGIVAARRHLVELGAPYAGNSTAPAAEDPAMVKFDQAQRLLLTRGTADAASAFALFRKAAENGNPLAAYDLAYCYEHGIGVESSTERAIAWYRRSAELARDDSVRQIAESGARNLLVGLSHVQR